MPLMVSWVPRVLILSALDYGSEFIMCFVYALSSSFICKILLTHIFLYILNIICVLYLSVSLDIFQFICFVFEIVVLS